MTTSTSMAFTSTDGSSSSFAFRSAVTRRRHNVFLSFRGEDTRHGITSMLHKALEDAGIPTFKDDLYLEKGDEIASELLKSVQMSRVAVIVFSRNYANSSWCLDELVKVVECKNESGQAVLPIFFDVDPSDVLNQTHSFANSLSSLEDRIRLENGDMNKLKTWRAALTEAASSPNSWDMHDAANWHQSTFIKEIVKHILSRYHDAYMTASIFPPRIGTAIEYLNVLLSVISDDVLVIGLCGVDKTLIAKAVFNQNFERFETSSYLSNVNAAAEQPDGLLVLQKRFLSDILMDNDVYIENVEAGIKLIKYSLLNKRILAVLDNVNKLDQLNVLARNRTWFAPGSRIIVTTRDPQLLHVLVVDDVYGDQGIQVIENQYRQNLQMIDDLTRFGHWYHAEARRREMILIQELEREQNKNKLQALVLENMQQMQSLPENAQLKFQITSTTEEAATDLIQDGFDFEFNLDVQE